MNKFVVIVSMIGVLAVASSTPITNRTVTKPPPRCRNLNWLKVAIDYHNCVREIVPNDPDTTIGEAVWQLCGNRKRFLKCIWKKNYEPGCPGAALIYDDAEESLQFCNDHDGVQPLILALSKKNSTLIHRCIKKYNFTAIKDCLFPANVFQPLTRANPLSYKEGARYVQKMFIDKLPFCFKPLTSKRQKHRPICGCSGITGGQIYLYIVTHITIAPLPRIDFSVLFDDVAGLLKSCRLKEVLVNKLANDANKIKYQQP